jgi:hypothetical protein
MRIHADPDLQPPAIYKKKLYLLALGVEGPGDVARVPLLQEEEVRDPVHGGAALPNHADGEGEEEGHGETHRVVQRQRQERFLGRQHLHRERKYRRIRFFLSTL